MLTAFLPASTPAWVRLAVEAGVLLIAARFLLGALRRGRIGTLALAAAAWMWFFWPPGHAWMLGVWHTALTDVRGLMPALMDQAKAAAVQSGRVMASTAAKRGR